MSPFVCVVLQCLHTSPTKTHCQAYFCSFFKILLNQLTTRSSAKGRPKGVSKGRQTQAMFCTGRGEGLTLESQIGYYQRTDIQQERHTMKALSHIRGMLQEVLGSAVRPSLACWAMVRPATLYGAPVASQIILQGIANNACVVRSDVLFWRFWRKSGQRMYARLSENAGTIYAWLTSGQCFKLAIPMRLWQLLPLGHV